MIFRPPEPVLRIPIVRLAAVEDRVDQGAIPIMHVLDQVMGGVVVIMVQQRCGPQPPTGVVGKFKRATQGIEGATERRQRGSARTRAGAKLWRLLGPHQGPKTGAASGKFGVHRERRPEDWERPALRQMFR
jgi:hypothetical protein